MIYHVFASGHMRYHYYGLSVFNTTMKTFHICRNIHTHILEGAHSVKPPTTTMMTHAHRMHVYGVTSRHSPSFCLTLRCFPIFGLLHVHLAPHLQLDSFALNMHECALIHIAPEPTHAHHFASGNRRYYAKHKCT